MQNDNDWIISKIGDNSSNWVLNYDTGLCYINYIKGKSKVTIFIYNIILLFRHLKRKIRGKRYE